MKRIQYFEKLEKEITWLREGLDEKCIKSKFENNSRILDDILSSQRPSSDRSSLGFIKEKNPESSPLTNQRGSTKSYPEVLKSPVKKEKCKEHALSSHDKDRTHEDPKRQVININQKIFLVHCYSRNNFGHKALKYKAYEKVHEYKKDVIKKLKVRNHN